MRDDEVERKSVSVNVQQKRENRNECLNTHISANSQCNRKVHAYKNGRKLNFSKDRSKQVNFNPW